MTRSFALLAGFLLAMIFSPVHTSAQTSSAPVRLAQAGNAGAMGKLSDDALRRKMKALAVEMRDVSRSKQERGAARGEYRSIRRELARRADDNRRAQDLKNSNSKKSVEKQDEARERRRRARELDAEKRKAQAKALAEKRKQQIEKRKQQNQAEADKRQAEEKKREAEALKRKNEIRKRREQADKNKARAEERRQQADKPKHDAIKQKEQVLHGKGEVDRRKRHVDEDKAAAEKRRKRVERQEERGKARRGKHKEVVAGDKIGADDLALIRALLNDKRPARTLSDKALRKRLRATRGVLKKPGMRKKWSRKLRRRLAQDRSELRDRVAARNASPDGDKPRARDRDRARVAPGRARDRDRARVVPGRHRDRNRDRLAPGRERDRAHDRRRDFTLAELLRDRRPGRQLNRRELALRIRAARNVLMRRDLYPRDRVRVSRLLRRDRVEFRERLHARRERRRRQLARERTRLRQRFDTRPPVRFEHRPDVAAAEADGYLIERQLIAPPVRRLRRRYTMGEIMRNPDLRLAMPALEIDTIRFAFDSDRIAPEEITKLERVGEIIERILIGRPGEIYLIEGHTDAPGSYEYNYALSQRRAEAVRAALLEYFVIPPRALRTAGFGEEYPRIRTPEAEPENRRVTLRRLTPLLRAAGR